MASGHSNSSKYSGNEWRIVALIAALVAIIIYVTPINCNASSPPLLVGIPYTGTGIWSGIGNDTLVAAHIWTDYIESIGGFGPFNQQVQLITVDVTSDVTPAGLNNTAMIVRAMLRGDYSGGEPVKYIISPYSSQLAEVAALEVENADAILLTGGAAAESVFVSLFILPRLDVVSFLAIVMNDHNRHVVPHRH
jgi:hypothetical protein